MKTRLPKALLIAVLASIATPNVLADAKKHIMTPIDIIEVDINTTADSNIYGRLSAEKGATYDAIVKDGDATLTIDNAGSLNINNTFIAREGATVIKGDTTITGNSGTAPLLMVGGLNASLELDGAKYMASEGTYNNAIIVGGRDGDGSLKLTNGAELKNNHGLFAGGQSRGSNFTNAGSFAHNCGSYVTKDSDTLYRDSHTVDGEISYPNFNDQYSWKGYYDGVERRTSKADITVDGASKLYVGYGINIGNVDFTITGKGTLVEEGHKGVSGFNANGDYVNRLGDTVYGGTKITVDDYATLTFRNNLNVSYYGGTDDAGFNGDTEITIGNGATMNSLRETYFGGDSYGAKSTLIVKDGGTANITDASAGFQVVPIVDKDGTNEYKPSRSDDIATIIVEKGGKYTGSSLKLNNGSSMTNNGTVELTDGSKVMESKDGVVTEKQSVKSLLAIDGGKFINNGTATTKKLEMSGGSLSNSGQMTVTGDAQISGGEVTFSNGTMRIKGNAEVTDSTITGTNTGTFYFDGNAVLKDTAVEWKGTASGSINLGVSNGTKTIALKGGNTFTSTKTQGINILAKSTTAEGNNSFYGATNVARLSVISGTQTFENTITTGDQTMSFTSVGFAANADESAAINISADRGQVFFRDNCEVTSVSLSNCTFRLWDTLVVQDSLTLGEGVTTELGKKETVFDWDKKDFVTKVTEASIVFEIDSIAELIDQPMVRMMTVDSNGNLMLNVADGMDLSNVNVELLFTENALNELYAIDGPVTLNLDKVTDLSGVELSLAVAESYGKTAEEVFGSSSVTTGAYNTGSNYITLNGQAIPEPTTATLSLLALMGLAARRRRK